MNLWKGCLSSSQRLKEAQRLCLCTSFYVRFLNDTLQNLRGNWKKLLVAVLAALRSLDTARHPQTAVKWALLCSGVLSHPPCVLPQNFKQAQSDIASFVRIGKENSFGGKTTKVISAWGAELIAIYRNVKACSGSGDAEGFATALARLPNCAASLSAALHSCIASDFAIRLSKCNREVVALTEQTHIEVRAPLFRVCH